MPIDVYLANNFSIVNNYESLEAGSLAFEQRSIDL